MTQQPQQNTQQNNAPEFRVKRIYVKDISFESPNSPAVFLQNWEPQVDINLKFGTTKLSESDHEVVLTVTVTTKLKDKVAFIAEVQQGGEFRIHNVPDNQINEILGVLCPTVLYPYVREVITDVIGRGGFPQLYLDVINFEALYKEQMLKSQENVKEEEAATH